MLQLFFLRKYKAQLFHIGLNQNICKDIRILPWEIGGFVPCFIIVKVRNFRKVLSFVRDLIFQTFFSATTGLICYIRAWMENFFLVKEGSFGKSVVFIHVSNRWSSRTFSEKKAVDLDFSRFSNSNFSESTALISSIKVSIESLVFVEEHSIRKLVILNPAS